MKITKHHAVLGILVLMASCVAVGQNAICPDFPNKVSVTVTPTVSFDPTSGLYTYSYVLSNGQSSAQEIASFAVDFSGSAQNLAAPQYWSKGPFAHRNTILWDASVAAPFPNGQDTGGLPPGLGDIKPGTSLGGFSFQSTKGPGKVNFYIHGYVDLPQGRINPANEDPESAAYTCPTGGSDFFAIAYHGTTTGPVNFLPVSISIKPAAQSPVPINVKDKGVTPVAILSTSTFDATGVDGSSLRFGPSGAIQEGTEKIEDVNKDGRLDLLEQFPTQNIGVSCSDSSLTLNGKTKDGTPIQGTQSIKTVGCK